MPNIELSTTKSLYFQRFALFNIPSPILICWQELLYNKQNTCCLFHSHNMSSNEVYFKQVDQKKVKDFEIQRQDKWQNKRTSSKSPWCNYQNGSQLSPLRQQLNPSTLMTPRCPFGNRLAVRLAHSQSHRSVLINESSVDVLFERKINKFCFRKWFGQKQVHTQSKRQQFVLILWESIYLKTTSVICVCSFFALREAGRPESNPRWPIDPGTCP